MPGARGEIHLTVAGQERALLYTLRALAEAEARLAKPMLTLLEDVSRRSVTLSEVAQLLLVGMEGARRDAQAGGRACTINDAWELMEGLGFGPALDAVTDGVLAAISYKQPGDEGGSDDENPPADLAANGTGPNS
ncbi:MAG TPA: GTA-gp10 family protein [Anaerolineae bacterium]|nr:GTA-gp10 family protein [Anaerolineae bacterium]